MPPRRLALSDHRPPTEQERRFAEEYWIDPRDPIGAAIRAGYSQSVAQNAREMLREHPIAGEVFRVNLARSLRTGITMDRIVLELGRIAFSDPLDVYDVVPAGTDADGTPIPARLELKPLDQIPEDARAAIESIEVLPGGGSRVKFAPKLKALEMVTPHIEAMNPTKGRGKSRSDAEAMKQLFDVLTHASKRTNALPSRTKMETTSRNGDRVTVEVTLDDGEDDALPEKDVTP